MHEEEQERVINSVVSEAFNNLHLERINEIQNNVEQTHREIQVDARVQQEAVAISNVRDASS